MFRSIRLFAALFVVLTATTANAQWASIKCTASGTGAPERYPKLLCDAEDLVRKGRYAEAVRAFEALSKVDFHEAANFEVLVDLARAQCLAGAVPSGRKTLKELSISLDYFAGKRKCGHVVNDKSGENVRAERRMCANEILHDSYRYTPPSVLSRVVEDVQLRRAAAESICGLVTTGQSKEPPTN